MTCPASTTGCCPSYLTLINFCGVEFQVTTLMTRL